MTDYSKEDLSQLTVVKLKSLAKEHDISKCSNKKKDDLVDYLFEQLKKKKDNITIDGLVNDVVKNIECGDENEADKIINNYIDSLSITEKYTHNAKYYRKNYDYINKPMTKKDLEKVLKTTLFCGDIIQMDNYMSRGTFIVSKNGVLQNTCINSETIKIPLHISKEFEKPIDSFKSIQCNYEDKFFGIELSKDDPYIVKHLGVFDAPAYWKYFYVKEEDEDTFYISIDIGVKDPYNENDYIQIFVDLKEPEKYISLINSIEYVKRMESIYSKEYESISLNIVFEYEEDELTEEQNNYLYNIDIPDYSLLKINPEYFDELNNYELIFSCEKKDTSNMMDFIHHYFFENKKKFIQSIEYIH